MSLEKNPSTGKVLELLGPTVEFLTSPQDAQNDFCVLKGTIPPSVSVPLHSHADTEDFLVISVEVEGLRQDSEDYTWIGAKAGDYIHVPSNARTPGVTSPTHLLSFSSSRPKNSVNSFRRRED